MAQVELERTPHAPPRLTLPGAERISMPSVSLLPTNFYAHWRSASGLVAAWHEGPAPPPEALLQAVWQRQRLRRDGLRTHTGERVEVLHPGFRNRAAGPDFLEALIRIGDRPPCSGPVEVDVHVRGWQAHGHQSNPAFRGVILHVVWTMGGTTSPALPTLVLSDALDAPLAELQVWLGTEAAQGLPDSALGHCAAPLRDLPPLEVDSLLRQAAEVRFAGKAAQLAARARSAGWEQALWEGVFRALGYRQNVFPMLRLAELRDRWHAPSAGVLVLQSRLLGLAGLLPDELTRKERSADAYLRQVWDGWWRERDGFAEDVLPRKAWRLANLRPANHPQRRLALAAHWLADATLPTRIDRWLANCACSVDPEASLQAALSPADDEFWTWHWTLRSSRTEKPHPLIGGNRLTDLAVNVLLPWLWARAALAHGSPTQQRIKDIYLAWPPGEDNARLRSARQRLLGGAHDYLPKTAAAQQGLLQILRDFCENSNAACTACQFPELVRDWNARKKICPA